MTLLNRTTRQVWLTPAGGPAHIHGKVSAPGHEQLTAQFYFPGDIHNDDDIATAVISPTEQQI